MNIDVCTVAKLTLQTVFDSRSSMMRFFQRDFSVHTDMHLDGITVAYPACTQVMRSGNSRKRKNFLLDFVLYLGRQRLLQQFFDTRTSN